jgi:IgGFc binding protein
MGEKFLSVARCALRVAVIAALLIVGSIPISPESPFVSWLNGTSIASADTPSTLGYEFSFIVPPNQNAATVYIYVSSAESGTGTWQVGSGSPTTFNLTANQATTLTVGTNSSANTGNPGSDADTTISGKMIRVTTTVPASVYADNNATYTSDATAIIPNAYLGTEYYALSMKNEFAYSRVSVLAIENSTTISITPKTTLGAKAAGTTYTVSLNAGQTYTVAGTVAGQDVTGTRITSTKAVAVFSSVDCFNGSTHYPYVSRNQSGACDVIYEQNPPVDAWGKNFITNGFADKNNGGTPVKILAKDANTVVSVNGSTVATLGAGEHYQYNYFESASATGTATNSGLFISATKSVLVGVFMRGGSSYGSTNQTGDPAMAYLAPFEQNLNEYTVVSATGNSAQLLNVTIPKSALSSLRIDGVAPSQSSPNSFVDFTANGTVWSLGQIITTTGSHNLRADQAFSVMVYGANSANSYAYTGGQSLAPIALVDSITLQTNGNYSGDVGQEVCIQVNVLDANGAALPGVRVDGSISGINSATALVGTSNNQGVASLCYESSLAGTDTVTLSSNGRSANTQVTWTVVIPNISYSPDSLSIVSGSAMPTISPIKFRFSS